VYKRLDKLDLQLGPVLLGNAPGKRMSRVGGVGHYYAPIPRFGISRRRPLGITPAMPGEIRFDNQDGVERVIGHSHCFFESVQKGMRPDAHPWHQTPFQTSVDNVNTSIAARCVTAKVRVFVWRKKTVSQHTRGPISTTRWRTTQGAARYLCGNLWTYVANEKSSIASSRFATDELQKIDPTRGMSVRAVRLPFSSASVRFDQDAAIWVLLQQIVVRGFVAVKFLAIGRILGPAAIGSVSIALLAVAVAEALSDTGLAQAVVQGRETPSRSQLGAVWTTLASRGGLIALLIVGAAPLMDQQFHLGGSLLLLQLAALLPLIRGVASPAYYIVTRERGFMRIAGVEMSSAFLDCAIGLAFALGGAGAYSVLLGMVAGETLKTVLTWTTMSPRPPLRLSWRGIGHYVNFSRWIWAGSVVNLLLNQFDKVIVAKLLGPAQLGAYQMSSKLAQMLLADAAIAMSQYLFPTFSAHHRKDADFAARLFRRYLALIAGGLAVLVIILRLAAEPLFQIVLGTAWLPAVPLFRIFVVNMAIGAMIAVLVSYLRAVGLPKVATHASIIQAVVLLVTVPFATHLWGVTGIAWAMTVGLGAAAGWMLFRIAREA
jgi:O-antigen/teichoic acid export membrane protein